MMYSRKVLDKGYVTLTNIAGPVRRPSLDFDASDRDAPQVARQSYNKKGTEERPIEQDMRLARFLWRNRHTSPFEQVQVWLDMKLPIFIARQMVRHRTARLNEVSGRYVTLPDDWYVPSIVRGKAKYNKQGSEDHLDNHLQGQFKSYLDLDCQRGYDLYKEFMSKGVAPEQARMFLHLNHYTIWTWNQDLHNLLHLVKLREGAGAQTEIQEYANAIRDLVETVLPETLQIFKEME